MATRGEEYIAIECELKSITPRAVLIAAHGAEVWIPRSIIHGADEIMLDKKERGQEMDLRIMRWKLEQEGLL